MKCSLVFICLIKCVRTRKESQRKQIYVADGKNEIINFAKLIA